jgi:putative glutamine amidotransferase
LSLVIRPSSLITQKAATAMPTPRKPLIGLTARRGDAAWTSENTRHYIDILNDYGADWVILSPDTPVTLPDGAVYTPDARGRLPLAALDQLDGLLLTGGGDVDPRYFGAPLAGANPKAIDPKRDELELNLTRRALGLDLPVFGICRGCQVMNVAAGGGMIQDFDGHRSPKEDPFYHDVIFDRGSRLYQTVGRDALAVNTYHHQGLDRASLAPAFSVAGVADPDGWLVEAIEARQQAWAVGVQWHPERLFELDDAHRRLWEGFLDACREIG